MRLRCLDHRVAWGEYHNRWRPPATSSWRPRRSKNARCPSTSLIAVRGVVRKRQLPGDLRRVAATRRASAPPPPPGVFSRRRSAGAVQVGIPVDPAQRARHDVLLARAMVSPKGICHSSIQSGHIPWPDAATPTASSRRSPGRIAGHRLVPSQRSSSPSTSAERIAKLKPVSFTRRSPRPAPAAPATRGRGIR